jgi:glycosyltransferase involved in cell wall biosynthesis
MADTSSRLPGDSAALRIGIWMEYFPDWLVALGRDGISRLIGYVVTGFAEAGLPAGFTLWGPSFAQDKMRQFVAELPEAARDICSVAPAAQDDPFSGAASVIEMLGRPLAPLSDEVRAETAFALALVTGGDETLYAAGPYEQNTRTDFVLTALAANRAASVDVWYVPSARFCHAALLDRPRVLSFPDYVFGEFPRIYHQDYNPHLARERHVFESLAQVTLDHSARVVTFSDTVRQAHVGRHFRYPADRVAVIRHGRVALEGMTAAGADSAGGDSRQALAGKVTAWLLAQAAASRTAQEGAAQHGAAQHGAAQHGARIAADRLRLTQMAALDWARTPFVFFPTVLRPYKNLRNLIMAAADLRDRLDHPCKLVTTADIWSDPDLARLLRQGDLAFDVLSLPKVPDHVLAALYALADAAIAPSFFEGGLPFMVSEALAVDTPVLLADIPVVREVMGPEVDRLPFFDPYQPGAIAEAMAWASDRARADRAGFLAEQRALFAPVIGRSWADAARDYEAVFRAAAQAAAAPGAAPVEAPVEAVAAALPGAALRRVPA